MGAIDYFLKQGVQFRLQSGNAILATGQLNDSLRAKIREQKARIVDELQWAEFLKLLGAVGSKYQFSPDDLDMARTVARGDLSGALTAYRELVRQIGGQ